MSDRNLNSIFQSIFSGDLTALKLALRHGADRLLQNKHGVTTRDLTESTANYNVVKFFR